ncbi:transposase family protein [Streptomyces sp. NPDC018036]|uniref:transposase family protein n=1 Tax=Streptomyces sp. NPDC018036 TaxID=3365035 RepID=UPI003799C85C
MDRLVATLIHLRHDLPHAVLALLYEVDRSTVTRAVGEVRRLLAVRGFAVPDRPSVQLRTVEDVFAYAQAEGVQLRLDATEIQGRRPAAGRGGRRAFVPGKKKQNTMKATVIADDQDRTLRTDALRPGRMHDATAARTAGIGNCFDHFDRVQVLLDDGYLGLSRDHRGKALTPPHKAATGSSSALRRTPRTPATRPLLATHHRRTHPRRPQTLEATPALDPPPRPPPRHISSHRHPGIRPHHHRLTNTVSRGNTTHPLSRTNSLENRVRVLGNDHPDKLTSRNNLADAYVLARHPAANDKSSLDR